jgi:hypothetical protein
LLSTRLEARMKSWVFCCFLLSRSAIKSYDFNYQLLNAIDTCWFACIYAEPPKTTYIYWIKLCIMFHYYCGADWEKCFHHLVFSCSRQSCYYVDFCITLSIATIKFLFLFSRLRFWTKKYFSFKFNLYWNFFNFYFISE